MDRLLLDEIETPDRIGPICHQFPSRFARANALATPPCRNAQACLAPEPIHSFVVDLLSCLDQVAPQFRMGQTIPPPPLLGVFGKGREPLHDLLLVCFCRHCPVTQAGASQVDQTTNTALRVAFVLDQVSGRCPPLVRG